MDKTYTTAGIVILIGVVIMAIAAAMLLAVSPGYWDDVAWGSVSDVVDDGKQLDMYSVFFDVGLMVVFIGIAILAFGLASAEPKPMQYRQVATQIPPQGYQYPPPQPPKV